MDFLDLKDISERYLELINPSTPEKITTVGRIAGLKPGGRVIDFGSGFGEPLALWAEHFGVTGIGIDIRPKACERARMKMAERGLTDRIQIICANAAEYAFEPHTFDVAACIGATFIWRGGFHEALGRMKEAIHSKGRLIVGEAYWHKSSVPPDYSRQETSVRAEAELLGIARENGFDFEYVARASQDDWDHYESENWRGLLQWLEENPGHPDRDEVIKHLRHSQNEYTRFGREYFGWAMYVLKPRFY